MLRFWKALSNRPPVYKESAYVDASRYKDVFAPKKNCKYEWVANYAQFNITQLLSVNETLDHKAESLIAVFAGGTGLVSLGAIPQLSTVGAQVSIVWGVALFFAVVCVAVAALVRSPKDTFLPPSIAYALQYADYYGDEAEATFLAQWHLACEGIRLSNSRKALGLKVAVWCGVLAICSLAVSFVVAIATIDRTPPSSKAGETRMSNPPAPVPNPASQPQTPPAASVSPAQSSNPQTVQASNQPPAATASPQSIQESRGDK